MSNATSVVVVVARAKAFAGQGVGTHKFEVESDGTVRVYDPIAGYYTLCHSLSDATQNRIRKLAQAKFK